MTSSTKNKILIITIFIELIIIGVFVVYPQIFKLESQIKFSIDPYQIIFKFNQPIVKSTFEKTFATNPSIQGELIWSDYNRQVVFSPKYLAYDLDYLVSIKNVRSWVLTKLIKKDIKFRIEPPSPVNLVSLKRIFPAKLPISEKNIYTKTNGKEIEIAPVQKNIYTKTNGKEIEIAPVQENKNKYIDVDIGDQVMALYENNQIIAVYEVSTGKYNMPTPLGEFSILSKEENHWSNMYKLWMPYSMQFYPGFFIHELPYWPSGYREGENHLGARVSHGCIRLGIGPAKEVFNFADIGAPVIIHN